MSRSHIRSPVRYRVQHAVTDGETRQRVVPTLHKPSMNPPGSVVWGREEGRTRARGFAAWEPRAAGRVCRSGLQVGSLGPSRRARVRGRLRNFIGSVSPSTPRLVGHECKEGGVPAHASVAGGQNACARAPHRQRALAPPRCPRRRRRRARRGPRAAAAARPRARAARASRAASRPPRRAAPRACGPSGSPPRSASPCASSARCKASSSTAGRATASARARAAPRATARAGREISRRRRHRRRRRRPSVTPLSSTAAAAAAAGAPPRRRRRLRPRRRRPRAALTRRQARGTHVAVLDERAVGAGARVANSARAAVARGLVERVQPAVGCGARQSAALIAPEPVPGRCIRRRGARAQTRRARRRAAARSACGAAARPPRLGRRPQREHPAARPGRAAAPPRRRAPLAPAT